MPVAVGPYGQTQPSCFDRVKMGFMMGFAVGMAAGAMFGTFSCLRYQPRIQLNDCCNAKHCMRKRSSYTWITVKYTSLNLTVIYNFLIFEVEDCSYKNASACRIGMRGRELMGGVGKTMMQSGGTFGTFMAIGMGIRC